MRLAVVIPVRNGEKVIVRCLKSLAAQTRLPDQVVVADNGSGDQTRALVQQAASQLPYPVSLVQEKRPGPSAARNTALKNLGPGTDVVAMLDADCLPRRDWLEQIQDFFQAHPEAAGLGGLTWGYQPRTLIQKFIAVQRYYYNQKGASEWVRSPLDFLRGTLVDTNNAAIRREVLESVGGFDEALRASEDGDLSLRILEQKGQLYIFHPQVVVYHEDVASLSGYYRKLFFYRQEDQLVYKKHFRHSWVIKLPLLPMRVLAAKNIGGMVNGVSFIFAAALSAVWFFPWWVLGAALAYAGFWMARFWPYMRHPEIHTSLWLLPVFWLLFVVARLSGRVARWWGGVKYRYWMI